MFLTAGKLGGRFQPLRIHANCLQRSVHPAAAFLWLHAQIFHPKVHILLYNRGDDLIIRVLEHHTHLTARIIDHIFVMRQRRTVYDDLPALGKQNAVRELG